MLNKTTEDEMCDLRFLTIRSFLRKFAPHPLRNTDVRKPSREVRFQVITAPNTKTAVFWVVASAASSLHHRPWMTETGKVL